MKARSPSVWLAVLALVVIGCQPAAEQPSVKQYDVTGKIIAVDADKQTVTLDHEDIPGLMPAMEMEFKIESPGVVEGIAAGDQVQGRLQVESGEYTVTHLEKR